MKAMRTVVLQHRDGRAVAAAKWTGSATVVTALAAAGLWLSSAPMVVTAAAMSWAVMPFKTRPADQLAALPASETVRVLIMRRESLALSLGRDLRTALLLAALFGPGAYVGATGLVAWLPVAVGAALLVGFLVAEHKSKKLTQVEMTAHASVMAAFAREWDGRESPQLAIARMGFKEKER